MIYAYIAYILLQTGNLASKSSKSLHKIQQIIEHYATKKLEKEDSKKGKSADVVDLKEYKMRKAMMFE